MKNFLEKAFQLELNNTSIKQEFIAGFTTFITMAYIIFVNPQMMATSGMDLGASFVGTCIAAAIACFAMGFYSNWPVGLAPGMGLNAFFTYTVVGEMGYSWEVALGAVFLAGILFVIISVTPLRQWMLNSIEATFLSLGNFKDIETLLAAIGFLLILVLAVRKVVGAIIIGVLAVTISGLLLGLIQFNGIVSSPPDLKPILLKLDILGAIDVAMISVIISFLFVNLFDTAGTLLGVASRANLIDDSGKIINLDKALKADSTASVAGSFLGCSPVTSYVESSAGVEAGGRTGLTAITIGMFFLIAIFFSPIASMVPSYATAGALIYVAILMLGGMERLDWSDNTELLPALIMIIMIPLTFSIANGIAIGFISYVVLKLAARKTLDISMGAWFLFLIFVLKFILLD
ncbi:MAG: NCS2 family permease [Betaproteobacteria bacterium]|nr:NCS2 family permease [Betaproteobacteria bacterium]